MEKKEFIKYLSEIFKSYGFNKKGNSWYSENKVILKKIELQKSSFGNMYYLNYGIILKELELQNLTMHIGFGLGSNDYNENQRIKELLNLENQIDSNKRKDELKIYIEKNILPKLNQLNNEEDILKELISRPHLNDIPLIVKKYFNLK